MVTMERAMTKFGQNLATNFQSTFAVRVYHPANPTAFGQPAEKGDGISLRFLRLRSWRLKNESDSGSSVRRS
jgi:hypothetical protein